MSNNSERTKQWREENKDKYIAGYKTRNKKIYSESKEVCLERHKVWAEANKDHLAEYARNRAVNNREKYNRYYREYKAKKKLARILIEKVE